jgi:hypothetical protein
MKLPDGLAGIRLMDIAKSMNWFMHNKLLQ